MWWIGSNHAFVVWAACFLWLLCVFEIVWSLLLFFCIGDLLFLTGTDLVNAFVLLSGIIMLPTNVHMLYCIAHGRTIYHTERVICCPFWLSVLCEVLVNAGGAAMCLQRMLRGPQETYSAISFGMRDYGRGIHAQVALDQIQYALKCCGINSYKDWFPINWYNGLTDSKIDDIENKMQRNSKQSSDSVPFSCCKSGSCVATFLSELGADSINTEGCGSLLYRIVAFSMAVHLLVFMSVILLQALLMRFIVNSEKNRFARYDDIMNDEVKGIMAVNENFVHTSASHVATSTNNNRSRALHNEDDVSSKVKQDIFKSAGLVQGSSSKSGNFSTRSHILSYGDNG